MEYPIYEYYYHTNMSLEEVLSDYAQNFYLKHYGTDKLGKVLRKIADSNKINSLLVESAQRGVAPNFIDFGSVINSIGWFIIQSTRTEAVAVLAAMLAWDSKVNSVYGMRSEPDVKNEAIKVFKNYSICEEMPKSQFERMTGMTL